jgi:hypothetical protein
MYLQSESCMVREYKIHFKKKKKTEGTTSKTMTDTEGTSKGMQVGWEMVQAQGQTVLALVVSLLVFSSYLA